MQRNVEKYMGWTIVIYGAPNVSGKRPAPDLAKRLRKKCEETNRHQKNISSINFEKNQWEKKTRLNIYMRHGAMSSKCLACSFIA